MKIPLDSIGKEWSYNDDGTRTLWHIHRAFGEWAVKFTKTGKGLVLERDDYWIDWRTADQDDWVEHIQTKTWCTRECKANLVRGLTYFRSLVSYLKEHKVLSQPPKRRTLR